MKKNKKTDRRVKMKKPAVELFDEVLHMEKITDSTEVSVGLLRAMNKTLLAGTNPETIIGKLRKMEIETQDSLKERKVFDL